MSDKKSLFIRKFVRSSRSPWQDSSTNLLYAKIEESTGDIDFSQYIYLHRDEIGRILGISRSKSLMGENPEFESQYLSVNDIHMYALLLLYIEEITEFTSRFSDQFEQVFMLNPRSYFEVAAQHWCSIIENAEFE